MSRSQSRRPPESAGTAVARAAPVDAAWSLDAPRVAAELGVDPARGLDVAEAAARLARHGPNRPRELPRRSALGIWLRQFRSLTAALLAFATVATFLSGHPVEGWAILAVLLLNSAIGFVTELRAARSMEALRQLVRTTARVVRGGELVELPAEQLVPGDVVVIEGGDVVPADLRLLEASRLQADESTLTGESTPVAKSTATAPAGAPLAERPGALFCGSAVTRGSGLGVVVATGERSEIGRIAGLVESTEPERTPLERQVARLSSRLVVLTLGVVASTVALGIVLGRDPRAMLEIGVALAVAAVPEGLPIVVTLALARGAWRMAHRHVLVRRLSAVASLGAANRILTDKTGTLTENRLAVVRLLLAGADVEIETADDGATGRFLAAGVELDPRREPAVAAALEIAALCNNAALAADGGGIGDPLESALLVAAARAGLSRPALRARFPELREEAFDPATRAMATWHRDGAGVRVAVKGAPEVVLAASTRELVHDRVEPLGDDRRRAWLERGERLAHSGLRVLALARRADTSDAEPPYRDLEVVALVGLLDPPRRDVRDAIERCRRGGIRVAMVTGDQPGTARAVARELDLFGSGPETVLEGRDLAAGDLGADAARLVDVPVFARVEPEQKLRLIRFFRDRGDVVAMLGDGVNDALALSESSLGITLGRQGTDIARESADVVFMANDLSRLPFLLRHARSTVAVIKQNIGLALALKLAFLAAAMTGSATLWMAVLADMGATFLVTFNGLRMLHPAGANRKPPV